MTLTISTEPADPDGIARVMPAGDLEISTRHLLQQAISTALAGEVTGVVVDLTDVEFIDSTGMATLVEGRTLCYRRGASYRVVNAQGMTARALDVSGVAKYLDRAEPD